MRLTIAAAAALVLALGSTAEASSYGDPAQGFVNPHVASAFVPLSGNANAAQAHGAAVVVAKGIAVTNAHNSNIVDPKRVLGKSVQYDLLFFRIDEGAPLPVSAPV